MKTMTVTLTNEEADQVEATARDQGLSPDDVLHHAVSAYLRGFPRREPETSGTEERPDLWFIGIGSSRDYNPISAEPRATEMDEELRDAKPHAHENQLWFIPESQGAPATSDIASRFDEVLAETYTRFLLEEEVSYSPEKEAGDSSDHSELDHDDRENGA